MNIKKIKIRTSVLILLFLLFANSEVLSQNSNNRNNRNAKNQTNQQQKPVSQRPKFPDRYAPLDNPRAVQIITEEMIVNTVEAARQSYIKGLILLQKNDTLNAIQYFESALLSLNKLDSYPEIEVDSDVNELRASILEDYKNCVKNLEETILVPKEILFGEEVTSEISTGSEQVDMYEHRRLPNISITDLEEDEIYTFSIPSIEDLVIPVEENDAINAQIRWLTETRKNRDIPIWMERSGKWFPMMQEIAEREGMPKEILLLSIIESSLNPFAVSKAGAVGLWQFMYPTGVDYGLNKRQSIWVDERRDPVKSTRAAMRKLRDLYAEFDDWYLTLVAYNWGWGNVRRALRQSSKQTPTFWDIRNQANIKMPREAREYVPLFIAVMKITAEPEKYGIDVTQLNYHSEFRFDVVEIEQATNLSAVAKSIGVGVEEIRELNPELLYDITPPDRKFYRLRVPLGSSKDFKTNFAKLSREEKQPSLNHRVLRGEDVISVAERFDVSIDELISLNNLSLNTIALTAGTDLKIPIGGKTYSQSTLAFANNSLILRAELVAADTNFHIALKDETIYNIAEQYGVSTVNLRNWNNLPIDQDLIEEGSVLAITESEGNKQIASRVARQNVAPTRNTASANRNTSGATRHTVRRGETVSGIAQRYGISVATLRNLNPTKVKGDRIVAGDILIVSNSSSSNSGNSSASNSSNSRSSSGNATYHKVVSGDTLSGIARRHNTTVDRIVALNRNLNPDVLSIGQRIRVK